MSAQAPYKRKVYSGVPAFAPENDYYRFKSKNVVQKFNSKFAKWFIEFKNDKSMYSEILQLCNIYYDN